MEDAPVQTPLHKLNADELKHLSLSTLVKDPTLGVPGTTVLEAARTKRRGVGFRWKTSLWVLILLVLIFTVGMLTLLTLFNRVSGGVNHFFTGSNLAPTPTPAIQTDYSQIDLRSDTDQDVITDGVETILGYDPNKNDCVREVGCGNFPQLPKATIGLNLIFIVDASGSMGEKINGVEKWQSAVSALKGVLDRGFPRFTRIGVILYGHKGGPSEEQRSESCTGVEVVESLGHESAGAIMERVGSLRPTGWTPLGRALEVSGEMLADQQGAGNFVIVLSDGTETCGGDPVAVAKKLKDGGINVTTNVVGLAVSNTERSQLEAIAQAGGGKFFPADKPEEVESALVISSESVRLWDEINRCVISHLVEYGSCTNVHYLKAINWVRDQRLVMQQQSDPLTGNGSHYDLRPWQETEKQMWDKLQELQSQNWKQYSEDVEKLVISH